MYTIEEVFRGLVEECQMDYNDLGSVYSLVRHAADCGPDPAETTLTLIEKLLIEVGAIAGHFEVMEPGIWRFVRWNLAPDETVAKIRREWKELGHDPVGGEVVWLTTSEFDELQEGRIEFKAR